MHARLGSEMKRHVVLEHCHQPLVLGGEVVQERGCCASEAAAGLRAVAGLVRAHLLVFSLEVVGDHVGAAVLSIGARNKDGFDDALHAIAAALEDSSRAGLAFAVRELVTTR